MKLNTKLFFYFSSIFIALMLTVTFFQYKREESFRKEQLDAKLMTYNTIIYNYLDENHHLLSDIPNFIHMLPDTNLRATIINLDGEVLFDSYDHHIVENHLHRPEIIEAHKKGTGKACRFSTSIGREFYYLAQRYPRLYIRTALPYNVTLRSALTTNVYFLYFMPLLLLLALMSVYFIAKQFAKSVLEHENRLKQQLTQNISHELKTPVSSISGYMESILDNPDLDPERQRFFIERSYQQARRLTALLQDISTLNKLNEGKDLYDKTECNLADIIKNVHHDVQLFAEQKDCKINLEITSEMPIKGNYSLLYSIFRNLMDNAMAYAGEHVVVDIKCYNEDSRNYYFIFSDNGNGVAEEHLSRLFDRFYRIDKGRSRKAGGTGLGLSIVKNAVLFHNGTICAKNMSNGGLGFVFSLHK